MKANEAPEKIYLHPDIGGREFLKPWLKKRANQDSVEYTRTDAFIEKMLDWVKNRAESFIVDTPLFPHFDYKRAIEDLKEYMKGE